MATKYGVFATLRVAKAHHSRQPGGITAIRAPVGCNPLIEAGCLC
jgi:hypothetical protein